MYIHNYTLVHVSIHTFDFLCCEGHLDFVRAKVDDTGGGTGCAVWDEGESVAWVAAGGKESMAWVAAGGRESVAWVAAGGRESVAWVAAGGR